MAGSAYWAGCASAGPAHVIESPDTTTTPFSIAGLPVPSIRRPLRRMLFNLFMDYFFVNTEVDDPKYWIQFLSSIKISQQFFVLPS
jgi:hypothetical protein